MTTVCSPKVPHLGGRGNTNFQFSGKPTLRELGWIPELSGWISSALRRAEPFLSTRRLSAAFPSSGKGSESGFLSLPDLNAFPQEYTLAFQSCLGSPILTVAQLPRTSFDPLDWHPACFGRRIGPGLVARLFRNSSMLPSAMFRHLRTSAAKFGVGLVTQACSGYPDSLASISTVRERN